MVFLSRKSPKTPEQRNPTIFVSLSALDQQYKADNLGYLTSLKVRGAHYSDRNRRNQIPRDL